MVPRDTEVARAPGRAGAAAASAHLATLGARRVAGRLAAVGLPAAARGRLVWCRLPVCPGAAAAAHALAEAVSPGVVVLVVAGPRPAALEPALAACDHVAIVAGAGEERLAEAALATLRAPGRAFVARRLGGPARRAAGLGLVRLRSGPDGGSPDKLARRRV